MKKNNYLFNWQRVGVLGLMVVGLIVSTVAFAADITTGLKLHYTFDAVTGTTVTDDSGNGNAGTLNGAMLTLVDGYSGQGVQGLVKDDYITLPANISTNLTSFTFATWVKVSALKNATRFFDFGNGADATNNFLCFIPSYNGDNQYMCLRYRPASGTAYNVVSTAKIPVGAWAHVAVTMNWDAAASIGNVTIYLNGAAVGKGTLPVNPSTLGSTTDNFIARSRWTQDTNGFNGVLDDIRFYDRALTADDILTLNGLAELNMQYANLSLGDLTGVTKNILLPTVLGTKGVTVRWATSNAAAIDTLGNVTQPEKFNAPVKLTATLTQLVGDKTYTMTKEFIAIVLGVVETPLEIAQWNFDGSLITSDDGVLKVEDTKSGFVGTCVNEARIRTIGSTEQFNVLDLGNNKGYFDMGTEIGKAIYSLTDYTMCGFFRIDDTYQYLNSNGNFYWTFSNSADIDADKNGYIIGSLKAQSQSVASNYYNIGNQATGIGTNAAVGGWHHFAYVQNGNTGTVYIDGALSSTNTSMTNLPCLTLPKTGLTGTLYNWLGRSNYKNDVYLRNTLLYDFRVYSVPLSSNDLNMDILTVPSTIDLLNNAFAENPDYVATELVTEKDNLSLGNLSAVTSNLTLPTKGTLDTAITISWKTTNAKIIDTKGVVMRPDYFNYNDTLTATLFKNGQSVTKVFPATVVANENSLFKNDLLVKYDFSTVTADTIVTDAAEKGFTGIVKKDAKIESIGKTVKFNVLNLGDSIGYFDMGTEVGKLMYGLNDYTMSAYYRIDTAYTEINSFGNFLWSLSNGATQATDQNGYIIASLKDQSVSITPKYYTVASGNQALSFAANALLGSWHNLTYTQSGTIGSIYIDGQLQVTGTITNLPSVVLPKQNQLGTLYNWLGRSCFATDAYLRKTMVYDFRLYKVALNDEQIQNTVLNVGNTINALDFAISELKTGLQPISESSYKVISKPGLICIYGLKGTEKTAVFDISGRQLKMLTNSSMEVNPGVYIVKIDNYVQKIVVK